ncbi:sensor histidine kinase [Gryllotalpicola protaetiae]|uniref:ATP-binding protein n=1 Tax=Gryllotalpicola protaetiae TaxID=2419771 RepID=A0A387BTF2_9MICO|nr:ATP-binding protein [Gryllotalpicola protaetiae]AYG05354.1 ATP-binding protein [Gryllotalpicola protaetiae]
MPLAAETRSTPAGGPRVAGVRRLLQSPELSAILIQHAYRGLRVQFVLRILLFAFMALAIAAVPPVHGRAGAAVLIGGYACWIAALAIWARQGGVGPVRWMWLALVVDVAVLSALTLIAGASDQITWTADLLVNGFFVIPVLAATQLRPGICAAVAGAATLAYLAASVATKAPNTEPWGSVLLRAFVFAAVAAACFGLSRVQLSRVLTIGQLAQQRTALLGELMGLEARERTLLAEQLHDGALQYVLAARMDLEDLPADGGSETRARIAHALAESGALLRETVTQLHPAVLEQAGLARALHELGDGMSGRGGLRVTVETDAWPEAATGWDALLYGSARELLANVAKHARAATAAVSLSSRDGNVVLVVADDGVGLSETARQARLAEGHIGLASLQTRIAAASGELVIEPGRPRGTTVTIMVPLA